MAGRFASYENEEQWKEEGREQEEEARKQEVLQMQH